VPVLVQIALMTTNSLDKLRNVDAAQMQALVERHLLAEGAGDIDGAVAVYTDDIEHDVVGFPHSPTRGIDGARGFYAFLTANFLGETQRILHQFMTDNAMILDQIMTGTVIGSMFGLPGNGRTISFRMLHVFEFRDGLISRENIWLDSAAVIDQLS
jgi:steroid delta-isomerase-like uncharacterized protein